VIVVSPGWVKTEMGGGEAPLTPETSAAGIAAVIDTLTLAGTGSFINYDGKPIPW
jgi:hypothetical protein